MDLATVTQTVSNLGFPIACVCAMFYFWNKEREQHEAECKEWMKVIQNNTDAINAMLKIVEKEQDAN